MAAGGDSALGGDEGFDPEALSSGTLPPLTLDPRAMEAMRSSSRAGAMLDDAPDYLDYQAQGKAAWEHGFSTIGGTYMASMLLGGLYGLREPSGLPAGASARVKWSSMMTRFTRGGSRLGNMAGAVAVIYVMCDFALDKSQVDRFLPSRAEWAPPVMAGALTGAIFKSTANIRVAGLAAVLGAALGAGSYLASQTLFGGHRYF